MKETRISEEYFVAPGECISYSNSSNNMHIFRVYEEVPEKKYVLWVRSLGGCDDSRKSNASKSYGIYEAIKKAKYNNKRYTGEVYWIEEEK